jgi:hypothetical protein
MGNQIKEIQGYEGLYRISSDGKVYSLNGTKKTYISNTGYERVNLWKKGKGKKYSIHRLVAIAFIPNPDNYKEVNHKDGNKRNNHVTNLEWCNASQNIKHAYSNNLIHQKTTGVIQYTKDFIKIKEWESIKDACTALKLNHANIVTVCRQNTSRKMCGGYIWRYADGNI